MRLLFLASLMFPDETSNGEVEDCDESEVYDCEADHQRYEQAIVAFRTRVGIMNLIFPAAKGQVLHLEILEMWLLL
ncbi:unnamed protein product [Heligmosomoides polygyrus]|uniref:Secreted protein n=1 Tax=Heligmosomoides polygyrus TaxID=6339 RepID=A0A183FKS6_HELPZ|nr:unnamed protein product [Heligmosomoides polygyrus]